MKEQSTTKGFAVLSAASMIVKIFSLLYVPFLQRIIGAEGYGVYSVTYTIFTFVYVLTNSGIPVAISKLVSELEAVNNYKDAVKAFKIARAGLVILGLVSSVMLILLAYPLTKSAHSPSAYLSVVALAPTIFITSVMSAYRGYFQGRGNMTPTAVSQIGEGIINTVFSLVFAAMLIKKGIEFGCAGATVGTTLGALFACIFLMRIYEKKGKKFAHKNNVLHGDTVRRLSNKALIKKLIYYSGPITLSVGLQNAGNLVDLFNIKNRLTVAGFNSHIGDYKFGVLGTYNVLINVPIALMTALSAAALPGISGAAAQNNRKLVQEKINYTFRLCFIIAVPAAIGLAVLCKPIYELLFSNYKNEYALMKYGSILIILMAAVQIQSTILQSIGKMHIVTITLTLGIITKVITNYILVAKPNINILGAVFGNMLCFLIPLILNNMIMTKALRIRIRLIKHMIKPLLASAMMGLIIGLVNFNLETIFLSFKSNSIILSFQIFVCILIGVLVYSYGLIITGGITKKDLNALSPRVLRLIPDVVKSRIR